MNLKRAIGASLTCAIVWVVASGCSSAEDSAQASPTEGRDETPSGHTERTAIPSAGANSAPTGAAPAPVAATLASASPPEPRAYSFGTCPVLAEGENAIQSGALGRTISIVLPPNPEGAGLVFGWHGLGDSPANFSARMDAKQKAIDGNVIVVIPKAATEIMGGLPPTWGFIGSADNDLALFDDVLACASKQWSLDRSRVYTTGFSAGGLWSTYLVMHRSEYLAAATIFSGGASDEGGFAPQFAKPARAVPVLAVSGGDGDMFMNGILQFQQLTDNLVTRLKEGGSFVIACNHGQGHSVPSGASKWAFQFLYANKWDQTDISLRATPNAPPFPSYCKWP